MTERGAAGYAAMQDLARMMLKLISAESMTGEQMAVCIGSAAGAVVKTLAIAGKGDLSRMRAALGEGIDLMVRRDG